MAVETIICPVCNTSLDLHHGILCEPEVKDGAVESKLSLTIKEVKPSKRPDMEQLLTSIEPYIGHKDLTIPYLREVLEQHFHVCPVHLPWVLDEIREAYQLYSPDLRQLKKY